MHTTTVAPRPTPARRGPGPRFFLLVLAALGASSVAPAAGQAPAGKPAAAPVTITHGPYLQNPAPDGVTIVWLTDKPCVSRVEYGTGEKLDRTAVSAHHGLVDAYTTTHAVTLNGLEPGTTYRYRVCSKEIVSFKPYKVVFAQTACSEPARFTTLEAGKREFSFVMVNDIHGKAGPLREKLDSVDWSGVDLAFLNGDSISHVETEKDVFAGFIDACVERFATKVPMVYVRGNHETRGLLARKLSGYLPPRDGRYYYAFSHGGVRFVVLDSGEDKADSADVYAGLVAFDPYRREQARWLAGEVASDAFRQAAWRIVVVHIPPWGGEDWHGELHARKVWGPILNGAGVDLMLCGHMHKHIHVKPSPQANAMPILINSNDAVLRVDVGPAGLKLRVTTKRDKSAATLDKVVEAFDIPPRAK